VRSGVICSINVGSIYGELKAMQILFIREKRILSSVNMLHKDYDHKGSDAQKKKIINK
jgi:hypothetical protein